MKKALIVLLFGIVLMLGSCVPYGLVAWRAYNAELVYQQELAPGESFTSETIQVDTDTLVQPALQVEISTGAIATRAHSVDQQHEPRYRFPLHYAVIDHAGAVLFEDRLVVDAGGARYAIREWVTGSAARLRYEKPLAKVRVPPPGRIQVRLRIDPDDRYQARLVSAQLRVYDNVYRHGGTVGTGIAMGVIGVLALFGGLIATLVAGGARAARSPAAATPASGEYPVPGEAAAQYAGFLHLGGLLSYLIPLGGLIAQLVMWLIRKDGDAYIRLQGITAINFRLSMLVYKLIAFALIFTILLLPFALLALAVLTVLDILFVILAAVSAFQGRPYAYPLAIRFLR